MKKLPLLLFSAILSFNAYGEYTAIYEDGDGNAHYIDFDTIKERDGYVYWWGKSFDADLSYQYFFQGDCDFTRVKVLQVVFSDELSLGGGEAWMYLPPESSGANSLEISCHVTALTPKEKQRFIEELTKYLEESQSSSNSIESQEKRSLTQEIQEEEDQERELVIDDQYSGLKSSYIHLIAARVKDEWRYMGAKKGWGCDVLILQDRDGYVEAVNVQDCNTGSSSDQARSFKNSIERAVYKASPLPTAPDQSVFDTEIMFHFRLN